MNYDKADITHDDQDENSTATMTGTPPRYNSNHPTTKNHDDFSTSVSEHNLNSSCDDNMHSKDKIVQQSPKHRRPTTKHDDDTGIEILHSSHSSFSDVNKVVKHQQDDSQLEISSPSRHNLHNDLCEQIAIDDPIERNAVLAALRIALDGDEKSSELSSNLDKCKNAPKNNDTNHTCNSPSASPKAQYCRPNTRNSILSMNENSSYRSVPIDPNSTIATRPGAIAIEGPHIQQQEDAGGSAFYNNDSDGNTNVNEEEVEALPTTTSVDVLVNAVLVRDVGDGDTSTYSGGDTTNTRPSRHSSLLDLPYAEATPMSERTRKAKDDPKGSKCKLSFYGILCLIGLGLITGVIYYFIVESSKSKDGNADVISTGNPTMSLIPTTYPSPSPTLVPTPLVQLIIVIKLDDKPEDTSWKLVCDGKTIYNVPPQNYLGQSYRIVTVPAYVGEGDDCIFTIKDAARDGSTPTNNTTRDGSFFYQIYYGQVITNPAFRLVDRPSMPMGIEEESISFQAMTAATWAPTLSPTTEPVMELLPPRKISIRIVIQLDLYPIETGWSMNCTSSFDDNDMIVFDKPSRSYTTPMELITETLQVPSGYMCQFEIKDDFQDGLCCEQGNGYYQVYVFEEEYPPPPESNQPTTNQVLLGQGGEFTSQDEFNIDTSQDFFPSPEYNDHNGPIPSLGGGFSDGLLEEEGEVVYEEKENRSDP